jgi:putative hydrolase of the HAD superfamily
VDTPSGVAPAREGVLALSLLMSAWIYTDADNTLWDTDSVYAKAQLALLQAAEAMSGVESLANTRLEFVRDYDQAIAARHHSRLRYPPQLLVRALREGLGGVSPESAAQHVLAQGAVLSEPETAALSSYSQVLRGIPPLLPSVREGMALAHEHGFPIYVVSEGAIDTLRARLRAHAMDLHVSGTLSAAKSAELYERMKQRAAPNPAFMIGDQPDRDIRLASEAGLQAVLVQGRFRPRWIQTTDRTAAAAIADTFLEAIKWIIGRGTESRA